MYGGPRLALMLALVVLAGSAGAAEPRRVRLTYQRAEEAKRCPDEQELRGAVEAELGYDPFDPQATELLQVRITREGGELVAVIELSAGGDVAGRRELASRGEDCRELAAALALAIGIAIDPVRAGKPPEPEPAEPAPPPPPPAPPPPPPAGPPQPRAPEPHPPPEPGTPLRWRVAGGGLVAIGTAPAPAAGIWVGAAVRSGDLSIGLEGRADAFASKRVDAGSVSASLLLASILPCWHPGFVLACGVGSIGALQGSGEQVDEPRKETTLFAAAGARLGVELPLGSVLALTGHVDVRANLTRTSLRLDDRDVWTTPPVGGDLGLGVRAEL
jgi:hypothetical protein